MLTKKELPLCPTATTVDLIGNKWKLYILRDLFRLGPTRFGALRKSIPGISQRVLTQNLRELEEDGIILRKIFAEVPPRVEYRISPLGRSLQPIMDALTAWGRHYKKLNK